MKRLAATIILAGSLVLGAGARPAAQDAPDIPMWVSTRLEALHPDDAWSYFQLAEEVGYELRSVSGRDLSRTLFVLSYHLDPALGSHVCLALADLTPAPEERQWLLAMGASMGAGGANDAVPAADETGEGPGRLAEGLRGLRAEDGRPLREAGTSSVVREYLAHLEETDPDTASALEQARAEALSKSGCPRCRNERIVQETGSRKNSVICPRCGGNPGLAMDEPTMLDSLRLEAHLRDAHPESWSGILVLQKDRPLRDIRPEDLAQTYGIDTDATRWSGSQGWHAPTPEDGDPPSRQPSV